MEDWVSLLEIFLNSPCPEGEASLWLQKQKHQSSSFLSHLIKPSNIALSSSSPSSSPKQVMKRCMLIETLPHSIQSRIISFLTIENRRFCSQTLQLLATNILKSEQHDFWVQKAAHNLLDAVSPENPLQKSNSKSNSILNFNLSSSSEEEEEEKEEEFEALPNWLPSLTPTDSLLPWLPLSPRDLRTNFQCSNVLDGSIVEIPVIKSDNEEEDLTQSAEIETVPIGFESNCVATLDPEIENRAVAFKTQLLTFDSATKTISLANEIHHLCRDLEVGDRLAVLGLTEPWETDDENASILLTHLSGGTKEFPWSGEVLCSVILPKLLILHEPASRVLVTAIIEYCNVHKRAAVDSLLFPLVLHKEGINTPLCDVLTRIVRECLHPAHISAFCQKLLCGEERARRVMCLPCHRCLVSEVLVWTEALFTLLQNILNQNVYLTSDSVDRLISMLDEMASRFSKSLKFGNFLLCLVNKCAPLSKIHKITLMKVAEGTNTFMTKSILSKLGTQ
ncbi:uncharacterized protein LOC143860026 [Tasmannia lanceolata]|uniref:uncharacterized protein LOC143858644 n=1 Tax=Tasmannia lanceolata TaxID=3420 RepID=UPI0040636401